MGGVVALEVFSQQPTVVQSMAIANSWCYQPDADARIEFMENLLKSTTLPKASAQTLAGLFAKNTPQAVIDAVHKVESSKDPDVFLQSWRSMFRVDYRGMLKNIDVPVVLIGGTEEPRHADKSPAHIHALRVADVVASQHSKRPRIFPISTIRKNLLALCAYI